MHSPGINDEGELRGQPANPGSPRKMAVKTECLCVYRVRIRVWVVSVTCSLGHNSTNILHFQFCKYLTPTFQMSDGGDLTLPIFLLVSVISLIGHLLLLLSLSCAKSHMLSASQRQPHLLRVSAVDCRQTWSMDKS